MTDDRVQQVFEIEPSHLHLSLQEGYREEDQGVERDGNRTVR